VQKLCDGGEMCLGLGIYVMGMVVPREFEPTLKEWWLEET